MKCRLSGRIAGTHDDELMVLHQLRFARARAIVETCSEIFFLIRHAKPPVRDSRPSDGGAGHNLRAVGQIAYPFAICKFSANALTRENNFGSEPQDCLASPLAQLGAPESLLERRAGL